MDDVVAAFNLRSDYFDSESSWAAQDSLNQLCHKLLLMDLPDCDCGQYRILDYGVGLGNVSRGLSEKGCKVDVADISPAMLDKCEFASNRYLVHRDQIQQKYDRIILRQVLQYVEEEKWKELVVSLVNLLSENGKLLFSQIVPYSTLDYSFWADLVKTRRPTRRSFPTEREFLLLCEEVGIPIELTMTSYTVQSLQDWTLRAPFPLQISIRDLPPEKSATCK
jgi:2-polyprenyl-3-methyl-5-hydroxy-6-metoxy-1,4-benzoquinol methylase